MKTVEWTDAQGYNHRALIRNSDAPEVAYAGHGMSTDPPDINGIDWEAVKRNLYNLLLIRDLTTWEKVKRSDNHIGGVFIQALKGPVLAWLREVDKQ